MSSKVTIEQIRQHPLVASANEWKDRIYINVRGNGGNYAGERSTKIWIKDNRLTVDQGKGMYSSEWYVNLKALRSFLITNGVEG